MSAILRTEILQHLVDIDAIVREKDIMPYFYERILDDDFKKEFHVTMEYLQGRRYIRVDGAGYFSLYPNNVNQTVDLNKVVIKAAIEPLGEQLLEKEKPKISVSNSQGTIIGDGNTQSFVLRDNSLNEQTKIINEPPTISTKPTMEKWQLWVAIIVGIIALLTGLKTCGYI